MSIDNISQFYKSYFKNFDIYGYNSYHVVCYESRKNLLVKTLSPALRENIYSAIEIKLKLKLNSEMKYPKYYFDLLKG